MPHHIIELDCPPGDPRPGALITDVVRGTPLEGLPSAHPDATVSRLFGCWTWAFPNLTAEQWADIQQQIKPRILALYDANVIRYGGWGSW